MDGILAVRQSPVPSPDDSHARPVFHRKVVCTGMSYSEKGKELGETDQLRSAWSWTVRAWSAIVKYAKATKGWRLSLPVCQ